MLSLYPCTVHILTFPSKIWAKKYPLHTAKYSNARKSGQRADVCQHWWDNLGAHPSLSGHRVGCMLSLGCPSLLQALSLSLTGWVTLNKLLHLSEPWSPCCKMGSSTCLQTVVNTLGCPPTGFLFWPLILFRYHVATSFREADLSTRGGLIALALCQCPVQECIMIQCWPLRHETSENIL